MISELITMISYPFVLRAFLVGIPVSLCASLLGVTLVLRKYSMIGDGLSHVGFGALAIAAALNITPMHIAVPVVILSAFWLLKIQENSKLNGDSAIAVISTAALAIGVMVMSLSKGMNADLNSYLFGSILAMSNYDAIVSIILSVIVISLFIIFYNSIFLITFDERFAKATGIKTQAYNIFIAVLTAITVVIGMRMMGSMLISALIIFPALTSMRAFKTFRSVTISSAIISLLCFIVGLLISCLYNVPTGACIVVVNLTVMIIFYLISKLRG